MNLDKQNIGSISIDKFMDSRFSDIKSKILKSSTTRDKTNIEDVEALMTMYIISQGKKKVKLNKLFNEDVRLKRFKKVYSTWISETLKLLKELFLKENNWLSLASIANILSMLKIDEPLAETYLRMI